MVEWLVSPLRKIGEGLSSLGEFMSNRLNETNSKLVNLINDIRGIPELIVDKFRDLFTFLFVPKEGFLDSTIQSLNTKLEQRFNKDYYINLINDLKSVTSNQLDDINVVLYGQEVTIINFSMFRQILPTLRDYIRGFMYAMLVLFNINQVYKLIRGTSLLGGSKKESEV